MKFLSILFAIIVLTFTSCKEKIDIETENSEPLLVVEAEITTETDSSYVKLSLTSNYYSAEENPIVSNANVNVNGVPFAFVPTLKAYKPAPGYIGKTDTLYQLNISYNGKTYQASSKLEPMFRVDSFFQTWKEAQGFLPAGFALSYAAFDSRPPVKYTYYQQFLYDTLSKSDTTDGNLIFFDNSLTPINEPYNFEIPFLRLNKGDEYVAVFKAIDKNMYEFLNAYANQNPDIPGPFQVPPANLPTNISNGGLGYFSAYDIKRWRYKVR